MRLGGNLRRKHPIGFFLWGVLFAIVLFVIGGLSADQATSAGQTAIDGIAVVVSFLGMVTLIVLGFIDLSRFLVHRTRGDRPAQPRTRPSAPQPPGFSPWQGPPQWQQQQPGPRQRQDAQQQQHHQEDRPLGERRVKILVVGYSASGKTVMLASLYHWFAHGTPAGIRFTTDDESNRALVDFATSIRDPRRPLPLGTQETKRWQFTVRVESDTQEADAFTLEYLDYAGGFINRMLNSADAALAEEFDPELKGELESTDVLMGVLDGERLVKLMAGTYDVDIVGDIERLLNILIRTSHRNVHLVITKWDLMRRPSGDLYTISEVWDALDKVSNAFRSFRMSPKLGASMRLIPVSALGMNGFVRQGADDSAARQPGISWMPWNVHVPFFSAIPDILASDVPKLTSQHVGRYPRSDSRSSASWG